MVCISMIRKCSDCYAMLTKTNYAISKPYFKPVGSGFVFVVVASGTNSFLHFRITAKLGLLSKTKEYNYVSMVHLVNDATDPDISTYENLVNALSIILSKIKNEIHY